MPFLLLIMGIILIRTSWIGNTVQALTLAQTELVGSNGREGFWVWAIAIAIVGAAGTIGPIRPFSNAFLWLIFVVLALSNHSGIANVAQSTSNLIKGG